FGTVFSDHLFVADYEDGRWGEPQILPYGPLPLPPAPIGAHYGQAAFEGFKAYRTVDERVVLFRPRANWLRLNRSAARLAMPEVPESLFLDGIAELVRIDREWIPRREGGSLYVRPVYFAVDEVMLVHPADRYRLVVVTCPVGPYFSGSVNLVAQEQYVRAFPGGTGDIKAAGNYAGSMLATRQAQEQGYHHVLWLDGAEHRLVEEAGLMNVVFVIDGVVVTPPLGGTILPGVTRDSVLTILREMGIAVDERQMAIDEVFALHESGRLTEAAGVGTAATVAPIGRIRYRDREIDLKPGSRPSVLDRAREQLEAIRSGRAEDRHGWLMPL
ncbi:MAG TPA: branched-chain amino acid aminotransferase, partial [Blastocatellia bacterium]|nr:branched-chain amino acid aminotransferase [Blastocatellia bacterium]